MLIQENTLRVLNSFYPFVRTVVFSKTTIELAGVTDHLLYQSSFKQAPGTGMSRSTNPYGTPFFKDMMIHLERTYASPFYGFCKGDVPFHSSLLPAPQGIQRNIALKTLLPTAGGFLASSP